MSSEEGGGGGRRRRQKAAAAAAAAAARVNTHTLSASIPAAAAAAAAHNNCGWGVRCERTFPLALSLDVDWNRHPTVVRNTINTVPSRSGARGTRVETKTTN